MLRFFGAFPLPLSLFFFFFFPHAYSGFLAIPSIFISISRHCLDLFFFFVSIFFPINVLAFTSHIFKALIVISLAVRGREKIYLMKT